MINIKIFALTPIWFLYAVIIGLLLSGVIIYGSVPHPVEVPVQVITPVSTPYPVVLTEHPTEVPVKNNVYIQPNSYAPYDITGFIVVIMIVLAAPFVLFLGWEIGKGMRRKPDIREIMERKLKYDEMRKMRR